ncbi:hypothetical protein LJC10_05345 [Selenomonadales bacterium OttesenSCG-928-I06]|nr:hypothetical protein [Selenomonadales bacterium OttesenSCG-928-I06]
MTRRYLLIIFTFCFIGLALMTSCANKVEVNNTNEPIEQTGIHRVETKNYAIYPSNIIENIKIEPNRYYYPKRYVNIRCPQFYYSSNYKETSYWNKITIEKKINNLLFDLSTGEHLTERDFLGHREYYTNYTITKSDENLFSIKFYKYIGAISNSSRYCAGVTIDPKTGELKEVTDYITIDESLIEKVKDGRIKYYTGPRYKDSDTEYSIGKMEEVSGSQMKKEYALKLVAEFIEDYRKYSDKYPQDYKNNSFYISDDFINLIILKTFSNQTYIILEIPR